MSDYVTRAEKCNVEKTGEFRKKIKCNFLGKNYPPPPTVLTAPVDFVDSISSSPQLRIHLDATMSAGVQGGGPELRMELYCKQRT